MDMEEFFSKSPNEREELFIKGLGNRIKAVGDDLFSLKDHYIFQSPLFHPQEIVDIANGIFVPFVYSANNRNETLDTCTKNITRFLDDERIRFLGLYDEECSIHLGFRLLITKGWKPNLSLPCFDYGPTANA